MWFRVKAIDGADQPIMYIQLLWLFFNMVNGLDI